MSQWDLRGLAKSWLPRELDNTCAAFLANACRGDDSLLLAAVGARDPNLPPVSIMVNWPAVRNRGQSR